jgi:hypothetical protein
MLLLGLLLTNLIESCLPLSGTNVDSVSSTSGISILSGNKTGWHSDSVKIGRFKPNLQTGCLVGPL